MLPLHAWMKHIPCLLPGPSSRPGSPALLLEIHQPPGFSSNPPPARLIQLPRLLKAVTRRRRWEGSPGAGLVTTGSSILHYHWDTFKGMVGLRIDGAHVWTVPKSPSADCVRNGGMAPMRSTEPSPSLRKKGPAHVAEIFRPPGPPIIRPPGPPIIRPPGHPLIRPPGPPIIRPPGHPLIRPPGPPIIRPPGHPLIRPPGPPIIRPPGHPLIRPPGPPIIRPPGHPLIRPPGHPLIRPPGPPIIRPPGPPLIRPPGHPLIRPPGHPLIRPPGHPLIRPPGHPLIRPPGPPIIRPPGHPIIRPPGPPLIRPPGHPLIRPPGHPLVRPPGHPLIRPPGHPLIRPPGHPLIRPPGHPLIRPPGPPLIRPPGPPIIRPPGHPLIRPPGPPIIRPPGHPIIRPPGHPLIRPPGHPLIRPPGHPLIRPPGHPVIRPPGPPLIRPPGHPLIRPPGHPLIRPPGHPLIRPPGHPIIRPPGHPLIRPPGHPLIRPPGHPLIRPPAHLDYPVFYTRGLLRPPRTAGVELVSPSEEVMDTEENVEEELGVLEDQRSVILHLLSQLKLGMDLTRVVLPTFILEKRSLLEMYANFMAHPDMFLAVSMGATPEERMVRFVEYYLTAFHEGRKGAVAKKPYNPILGETFHCSWEVPRDSVRPLRAHTHSVGPGDSQEAAEAGSGSYRVRFVAEQVSHHPPVSAFYCECRERGMCVNVHVWTKSKFMGMSVGVSMVGEGVLSLLEHGEEYVFTLPSAYARSILTVPWVELGGKVTINCAKSGYSATVTFHTKPFYGGKVHRVTAEVKQNSSGTIVCKAQGEWNGTLEFSYSSADTKVFDTTKLPVIKKLIRPEEKQGRTESRRLWQHVTKELKEGNIDAATEHKHQLEEGQRAEEKQRADSGSPWKPKYFTKQGDGWLYHNPLWKTD
ncbi:hypothetical protein NFI96_027812 [Prochilodus magdalenae]|nr:hypothetical protein NFI96_027812 [Prochilodus magdalenae]